jgi:hypothetical protein
MKNPNDLIENQTRDLPAFSAVPQLTALLRTPDINHRSLKIIRLVNTDFVIHT